MFKNPLASADAAGTPTADEVGQHHGTDVFEGDDVDLQDEQTPRKGMRSKKKRKSTSKGKSKKG
eukprot:COSAG01_NODE_54606_length_331_cov_0.581897_1_plen_63_part_10